VRLAEHYHANLVYTGGEGVQYGSSSSSSGVGGGLGGPRSCGVLAPHAVALVKKVVGPSCFQSIKWLEKEHDVQAMLHLYQCPTPSLFSLVLVFSLSSILKVMRAFDDDELFEVFGGSDCYGAMLRQLLESPYYLTLIHPNDYQVTALSTPSAFTACVLQSITILSLGSYSLICYLFLCFSFFLPLVSHSPSPSFSASWYSRKVGGPRRTLRCASSCCLPMVAMTCTRCSKRRSTSLASGATPRPSN